MTGRGAVSKGVYELISDCIPHEIITPKDISKVMQYKERKKVFVTTFTRTDYLDLEGKTSNFGDLYLDKISILFNCINWTQESPRLITN